MYRHSQYCNYKCECKTSLTTNFKKIIIIMYMYMWTVKYSTVQYSTSAVLVQYIMYM